MRSRCGTYLYRLADLPRAIEVLTHALTDYERLLGADHPDTLLSRNNLANAYMAAGRVAEAITVHEATLADCERVLGADHPGTRTVRDNYAVARTAESSRSSWWRRLFNIRRREH
ncbi:tetratricopeptide repeat protein [Streptosporangium sp. H16]|uniref:tetratricopeptide repeat protein n=1 Tax=Streptosporangium sp. H16 TaxID=3444184 RepID=UPI003F79F0C3